MFAEEVRLASQSIPHSVLALSTLHGFHRKFTAIIVVLWLLLVAVCYWCYAVLLAARLGVVLVWLGVVVVGVFVAAVFVAVVGTRVA